MRNVIYLIASNSDMRFSSNAARQHCALLTAWDACQIFKWNNLACICENSSHGIWNLQQLTRKHVRVCRCLCCYASGSLITLITWRLIGMVISDKKHFFWFLRNETGWKECPLFETVITSVACSAIKKSTLWDHCNRWCVLCYRRYDHSRGAYSSA